MKSTIAISKFRRLRVQPCKTGGLVFEIAHGAAGGYQSIETITMDESQAGALIFAIEAALEANGQCAMNDGVAILQCLVNSRV